MGKNKVQFEEEQDDDYRSSTSEESIDFTNDQTIEIVANKAARDVDPENVNNDLINADEFDIDSSNKQILSKQTPAQQLIKQKIDDIIQKISQVKKDDVKQRQSLLKELKNLLCEFYGYNHELMELFMKQFKHKELLRFLDANEIKQPMVIRTNTLKTNRKQLAQVLTQRGVDLEPFADWTKVALKINSSKIPIGASPEYLAGHYMLQSASSLLPVIALAPQNNEKILDMASAPGGKSTYISQLMKNTGTLLTNDFKLARIHALRFNLLRMGCSNSIVTNYDGRDLPQVYNQFDRVLLDSPCTGLGIINRDPKIKQEKTVKDVMAHQFIQKELLSAAIDCCKKNGYIVYSTCSVAVQENEMVIDYILKNRNVKLVETGLEIGSEGYTQYQKEKFDESLTKTRRIFPHVHQMDGFYVAKLKKLGEVEIKKDEKTIGKKKKKLLDSLKIIENNDDKEEIQQKLNEIDEKKLKKRKNLEIIEKNKDKVKLKNNQEKIIKKVKQM